MKASKTPYLLIAIAVLIAACAGPAAPVQPTNPPTDQPTQEPTSEPGSVSVPESAKAAIAAQLNLNPDAVTIISAEKVEWPDGCLGVYIEGMACIQVITPGYNVVAEIEGNRYEYHTDETGANVVLASIETSSGRLDASDGPVLAWHREGGIAGFCDDLTVYVTGDVFASSCKGNQPTDLGRTPLTAEQLAQVYAWVDRLKSFEFEQTDPAKADQMTIRIVFSGAGSVDATDADIQAIQQFASELFAGSSQR